MRATKRAVDAAMRGDLRPAHIRDMALEASTDPLRAALEAAGFEPDSNICARCKHHGGDHDLANWCLLCPRPDARGFEERLNAGWCFFSSMSEDEKWEHGLAIVRYAMEIA